MSEIESSKSPKLTPRWNMRRIRRLGVLGMYGVLLLLLALVGYVAWINSHLPDVEALREPPFPPSVVVLDRRGEVIARRGGQAVTPTQLETLPAHLIDAVLTMEDRRFFTHGGLDARAVARAGVANLRARDVVQGGSTITQQLAKTEFLTPERSWRRKIEEVLLARRIENRFGKGEILEFYLDRAYFGSGATGVEAAARTYFDKTASEVTLAEAAILAGLLQAPSRFSPRANRSSAGVRAGVVLDTMVEAGKITDEERRLALNSPVMVRRRNEDAIAGHFVDWVMERAGEQPNVRGRDIIIETTLDMRVQQAAHRAVSEGLDEAARDRGATEGALIALEGDGAIRALVGGRNYALSQYNRAIYAQRQPGSAFKPVVYAAGLRAGLTPDSVFVDRPLNIDGWRPSNFSGQYTGDVTVSDALTQSINTVAVQVSEDVGRTRVIGMARDLGLSSRLSTTPSLALGSHEVTLKDLTSAFGVFANEGFRTEPFAIVRILDQRTGETLYTHAETAGDPVLSPIVVADMNAMLANVVRRGTGRAAHIEGRWIAGKTGTSSDFRDAWFVGYTPGFVAGVWVGDDANAPMQNVTGGQIPAAIWRRFMADALQGQSASAPLLPRR